LGKMADQEFVGGEEGGEGAVVRIGKRVFIGNLAWKTSWQDLKDRFRECGNVVYVRGLFPDFSPESALILLHLFLQANVMRDESGKL